MNKESEQEAFVNSQPEERTESLPAGGADKPDGVKTEAEAGTRAGGEYDGSRPEGEAIKTAAEETEKKEETAIAVRFNGKDRQVSPEDARSYVEMGMKWESFRPAHEKLRLLAAREGTSVARFIDSLMDDRTAEAGADEDRTAARLAEEFTELAAQVPGIRDFGEVPEQAVLLAAEKGVTLFDAYLRFRFEEERRREREQDRSRRAAGESAGSLSDGGPAPDPEREAFIRSFRLSVQ
ncbi:MAG: hypothetical protein HFJ79_05935 [Clostridiales bacterium]|jgi:hypothetical protein|nr:hypothetical protein [Clostridiales bacterium]